MTRRIAAALAAFAAVLSLAACARQEEHRLSSVDEDSLVARDGDVYIASQPSLEDLDAWADRGVTTVVNFRSRAENASLPFDPAAEAQARGMSYVSIPMGGADGIASDIPARLDEVLADADGPVVLHCRTGVRAANAYAARLVADGEASEDDLDDFGWPGGLSQDMLAQLLGE